MSDYYNVDIDLSNPDSDPYAALFASSLSVDAHSSDFQQHQPPVQAGRPTNARNRRSSLPTFSSGSSDGWYYMGEPPGYNEIYRNDDSLRLRESFTPNTGTNISFTPSLLLRSDTVSTRQTNFISNERESRPLPQRQDRATFQSFLSFEGNDSTTSGSGASGSEQRNRASHRRTRALSVGSTEHGGGTMSAETPFSWLAPIDTAKAQRLQQHMEPHQSYSPFEARIDGQMRVETEESIPAVPFSPSYASTVSSAGGVLGRSSTAKPPPPRSPLRQPPIPSKLGSTSFIPAQPNAIAPLRLKPKASPAPSPARSPLPTPQSQPSASPSAYAQPFNVPRAPLPELPSIPLPPIPNTLEALDLQRRPSVAASVATTATATSSIKRSRRGEALARLEGKFYTPPPSSSFGPSGSQSARPAEISFMQPFESESEDEGDGQSIFLNDEFGHAGGRDGESGSVVGFEMVVGLDDNVLHDISPLPLPRERIKQLEQESLANQQRQVPNTTHYSKAASKAREIPNISPVYSPVPGSSSSAGSPASFKSFTPFSSSAYSRRQEREKEKERKKKGGIGSMYGHASGNEGVQSYESLATLRGGSRDRDRAREYGAGTAGSSSTYSYRTQGARKEDNDKESMRLQRFEFETWLDMDH